MQQEAKLFDVPVLIDAVPEKQLNYNQEQLGLTSFSYRVPTELQKAVSFYNEEMERFGWKQFVQFCEAEALLIFEKPNKICSISLRSEKKALYVLINLKLK